MFTAGKHSFKIVTLDHQGQWSVVLINGARGIGYEIDREHRTYSTLDLKTTFEVQGPS